MKIYHNPKCSKSRQTLAILQEKAIAVEIIEYLKTPPDSKELKAIIERLGISAIELIRVNEELWKDQFKGKNFTETELIQIMIDNPKLIERPIVVNGMKAVIGRPPENVLSIMD